MALLGVGIPMAGGSPGLGIVLICAAVITGGVTLRLWLAESPAETTGGSGVPSPASLEPVGPRIVAGEVNSKYSTVGGPKTVDKAERQWPTIRLYAIPFRNVAETGDSASTASDVVATAKTFAEDGAFLDRAHGRWRELSSVAMELNASSALLPAAGVERAGKITLAPTARSTCLMCWRRTAATYPARDLRRAVGSCVSR